jgi:hypothetical protein
VCALAAAVACGKKSESPASPSAVKAATAEAAPDGSTLKASAPTLQSPINNQRLTAQVLLTVANASPTFTTGVPLSYEFEIFNSAGALVYHSPVITGGASTTSHVANAPLDPEQPYQWTARAVYQGLHGPWAARGSFIAPQNIGYIRGNELYDPLINGRTVGQAFGDVTFIPGLGARLNSQTAYIAYELPQTLFEGEFSLLVTNLAANTEGGKTKLFAMGKGYDDIVTNEYRMTVEKRGDPPGIVAWRFIARDDQIDTEGAERTFVDFRPDRTYFWKASWRSNFFNLLINEGGVNGPDVYDMGKHWEGRGYEPSPHVLYIGAPVGRSGVDGASVNGVIIRQVWVSPNSRPAFANQ